MTEYLMLVDLENQLSTATGPNWRTDIDLAIIASDTTGPKFTSSLDAAIALCDRMLPGWQRMSRRNEDASGAFFTSSVSNYVDGAKGETPTFYGQGPNDAIALCLAIVRALKAKESKMTHDELVEKVARTLWEVNHPNPLGWSCWGDNSGPSDTEKEWERKKARVAIRIVGEACADVCEASAENSRRYREKYPDEALKEDIREHRCNALKSAILKLTRGDNDR